MIQTGEQFVLIFNLDIDTLIKVVYAYGFGFCHVYLDKYIICFVIFYFTLFASNSYMKWIGLQVFEVQTCQISFGKHVKTDAIGFTSNRFNYSVLVFPSMWLTNAQ